MTTRLAENQNDETAIVQRDDARLGLICKPDHKPGEAGSCAFAVTDLDAMRAELDGRGLDLGGIRIDNWGGVQYRGFFLREAENGLLLLLQPTEVAEGMMAKGERRGVRQLRANNLPFHCPVNERSMVV